MLRLANPKPGTTNTQLLENIKKGEQKSKKEEEAIIRDIIQREENLLRGQIKEQEKLLKEEIRIRKIIQRKEENTKIKIEEEELRDKIIIDERRALSRIVAKEQKDIVSINEGFVITRTASDVLTNLINSEFDKCGDENSVQKPHKGSVQKSHEDSLEESHEDLLIKKDTLPFFSDNTNDNSPEDWLEVSSNTRELKDQAKFSSRVTDSRITNKNSQSINK